jgi:3D (Asp-Asp-Asp) domain-containing protein
LEVEVKTGDSSTATAPREPLMGVLQTRRLAQVMGAAGIVGLTIWSAILTKEARNPMPLLSVEPVAVGEPSLPGDRLAGVSEVSDADVQLLPEFADEFAVEPVGFVGPEAVAAEPEMSEEMRKLCADPSVRWFNGRPVKPAKVITMKVTAYSPDARSCGDSADGLTATMHSVETNAFRLIAADPKLLPYGSMLTVPGYAENSIVPVLDCGGAIKGKKLDVLFPTHEAARKWGVKDLRVIVWQYVDGKPADNPRKLR